MNIQDSQDILRLVIVTEQSFDAPLDAYILVVSFIDNKCADFLRIGQQIPSESIVDLITHSRTFPVSAETLHAGLHIEAEPPSDQNKRIPVAILAPKESFWSFLQDGRGMGLVAVGQESSWRQGNLLTLGPLAGTVNSHRIEPRSDPERFQQVILGNNDGESYKVMIYLPANYGVLTSQRYATVYLLPGLGGNELVRLEDSLVTATADICALEGCTPSILIGVNAQTSFGSWYLTEEETSWSRFLTQNLVKGIDERFRTLVGPEYRVLIGQSTGGFNSIFLALTRPGVYGTIAAAVPDALDLEDWLLTPDKHVKDPWLSWMKLEEAIGGPGQMISYARSWSPTASGGYLWPVDLNSGMINKIVLEQWLQRSPMRLLDNDGAQMAIRSLAGNLSIRASCHDEFDLYRPARCFCDRLNSLGIEHVFQADSHSHFNTQTRIATLLEESIKNMSINS